VYVNVAVIFMSCFTECTLFCRVSIFIFVFCSRAVSPKIPRSDGFGRHFSHVCLCVLQVLSLSLTALNFYVTPVCILSFSAQTICKSRVVRLCISAKPVSQPLLTNINKLYCIFLIFGINHINGN